MNANTANDTGLPNEPLNAPPFSALSHEDLCDLYENLELAIDVSKRRPDTPAELETLRYLRATKRYTRHLIQTRKS
ncbi:hypothetical protein [Paracoccus sp. (in: a-proteobacteria)]|uniref:hypothetical protein n=1 Tax=Paracoccus sp. TaxID=267 RepID=UPI00289BE544|nr:hypothetical protein [Paracoccus sp. (in: a-proteobacteria)]